MPQFEGPRAADPDDDDDATRIAPVVAPSDSHPPTHPLKAAPSAARVTETLPGNAQPGSLAMREVGRYQIQDRLGRGGMATVYRAHDPGIGRDVAVKFLHASLCEDEEYRGRFLREARAAGGLSHPNIVTVFDVGEIQGRPYMAMELIDGEVLSDVMAEAQPQPVRDVVLMGLQLARALDYAHSKRIVHRDIKPGNIVRLKGTQTIKVMDFGIARIESAADTQRTRVGDVLGTPQYMSPEQAMGEKLDGRSDLFSTGIVLYQLLTGQRPFQGDSMVALAMKITQEEPPPMDKLRPGLPPALRRVVERCLSKQPERRFQTGMELASALAKVLAEIDEAAQAKNRPRIVPLRVKWAGMMALIVAVVMAATGALITQRQYAAMMAQVTDYGASLARFIAAQHAVSALAEDWITVDVAVKHVMQTGDLQSVTVIDRQGIVQVSPDASLVGQPYKAPAAQALGTRSGGVAVKRYTAKGESVLGFDAPILFQNNTVGRVSLGILEKPLTQVARLSMTLMIVLVLVTVLAVAVAMFFVANWFAKPIKLVRESMAEIAKGRFDHRIREQRKDEFGLLYAAFDQMAQALEDRRSGAGPVTPTGARVPVGIETPVRAPAPTAAPQP